MDKARGLAITLRDFKLSGVYRLPADGIEALSRIAGELGLAIVRADLSGCVDKDEFLQRMAASLNFPPWFGHNWDALADCMADLSWLPASGYVIILEHTDHFRDAAAADLAVGLEILDEAAQYWAKEGVPMWVFVDVAREKIANLRNL